VHASSPPCLFLCWLTELTNIPYSIAQIFVIDRGLFSITMDTLGPLIIGALDIFGRVGEPTFDGSVCPKKLDEGDRTITGPTVTIHLVTCILYARFCKPHGHQG
jgi:hypothetical protein